MSNVAEDMGKYFRSAKNNKTLQGQEARFVTGVTDVLNTTIKTSLLNLPKGQGLYGVRLYGTVALYKTGLYGVATSKTELYGGKFFLLRISHVSFIDMSYKSDKSFKSSKLECEIINLNYNQNCQKLEYVNK